MKSGKRLPCYMPQDATDLLAADSILLGKKFLGYRFWDIDTSDLFNLKLRELGPRVPLSFLVSLRMLPPPCFISFKRAAFHRHIVEVVFIGPLEEMGAVTARGVVASVTDEKRVGIFPIVEKISNSTGKYLLAENIENPVVVARFPSIPRPAFIRAANVYLGPETGDVRWRQRRKWLTLNFGHLISFLDRLLFGGRCSCTVRHLLFYPDNTRKGSLLCA